jgi:hypothetical protein
MQTIRNACNVLTSSAVCNTVTLHGAAFHKDTSQMKNRNGTRSNVEHVKFEVGNKIRKNIIYRKKTQTREEEKNLLSAINLECKIKFNVKKVAAPFGIGK